MAATAVMGHVITDIVSKDDPAIEIVAGVDMNTENYARISGISVPLR